MPGVLEQMLAQAPELAGATLRLAPRARLAHQSNHLYDLWADGRHLIVKEYRKPDEWLDAPVREFRALQIVGPLDIAPRPVLARPLSSASLGPIVVYEWMEGAMWDRRPPSAAGLAQLADVWLAMHTVSGACDWRSRGAERRLGDIAVDIADRFRVYAAWTDAGFPAARLAADRCLRTLAARQPIVADLAARAPVQWLCRSDPRFANVIERPDGRLGMVDWEDSGLRDPAIDLADLVTHPNQEDLLTWEAWQAFLRPYLAVQTERDPDLDARMRRYLALFPLFYLSVLLSHGVGRATAGRLTGWTINEMPANQRLRRFLARAVAWPEPDITSTLDQLGEELAFFPDDECAPAAGPFNAGPAP